MWIIIGTMAEKYRHRALGTVLPSQFPRLSKGLIAVRWLWRVNELLGVKRILVNINEHQLCYHREAPPSSFCPAPHVGSLCWEVSPPPSFWKTLNLSLFPSLHMTGFSSRDGFSSFSRAQPRRAPRRSAFPRAPLRLVLVPACWLVRCPSRRWRSGQPRGRALCLLFSGASQDLTWPSV